MQARAQATDELLESGVLEDLGGGTDDIQKELDEVSSKSDVDAELASLKAHVGPGAPAVAPSASIPVDAGGDDSSK
jgi:phage shock protein A